MSDSADRRDQSLLQQLVDLAAVETDKVKFADLLRQIAQLLAKRRSKPIAASPTVPGASAGDTFDIFSGSSDRDAMWVESVDTLQHARERLKDLSESVPGEYFIFHAGSRSIIRLEERAPAAEDELPPKKSGTA